MDAFETRDREVSIEFKRAVERLSEGWRRGAMVLIKKANPEAYREINEIEAKLSASMGRYKVDGGADNFKVFLDCLNSWQIKHQTLIATTDFEDLV